MAKLLGNHGILILKILAKVKTDQVPVRYMNFGDHNVKFFKGTVVGNFEDTMGIIDLDNVTGGHLGLKKSLSKA